MIFQIFKICVVVVVVVAVWNRSFDLMKRV